MTNASATIRKPIAVVVGPTAVGKTALAVELALALDGEIVTADSMQVYRGMDIGTAKPTLAERRGVPHHLIDVCDPDRTFNVAEYQTLAHQAIEEIHARHRLPIVAGGSGLYVKAVLDEFLFPDEGADPTLRQELEAFAEKHGKEALHRRLASVDPEAAGRIHPNDVRRVVRALEVYLRTGRPFSEHVRTVKEAPGRYRAVQIGLTRPRSVLYERIDARVDAQIEAGLIDEVRTLMARYPAMPVARQALGYKEMMAYLEGKMSLEDAIDLLKRDTRRFAKRQFTWFRRDPRIQWFDLEELEKATDLEGAAARIGTWIRSQLNST